MAKHRLWTLSVIAASVTGCASDGAIDIRPVGRQAVAGQPASVRLGFAQGHLALGNVALALEEFRRAEREAPGNVAALAGMAECYRQMGRTDLSRRYYEQALAVAPHEPQLYVGLARAFESDGQDDAARSLRAEAAERAADKAAPTITATSTVRHLPIGENAPSAAVTVMLAPPREVTVASSQARLERLSSGEVALVTAGRSPWAGRRLAANAGSANAGADKRQALVVLNGARIAGIAARTRDYLAARGLAKARIGDAPAPRARSVLRYPLKDRDRALHVAAQFRAAPQLELSEGPLTLIVGRDAAVDRPGRRG